jgi:hypothetical protein
MPYQGSFAAPTSILGRNAQHASIGQRLSFINQHDGDTVSNLVQQFAVIADQPVRGFSQVDVSLAFWARMDVQ